MEVRNRWFHTVWFHKILCKFLFHDLQKHDKYSTLIARRHPCKVQSKWGMTDSPLATLCKKTTLQIVEER